MKNPAAKFDSRGFLACVTNQPGVYIFVDADGNTLYVGKARNLKKRLQSYFRSSGLTAKTALMVSKIARAQVQQTRSDSEALLLENNLIKDRKPRYNISLRDDKSFPYIRFTDKDVFPRFTFYRGGRSLPGKYYGPYPNAAAVREMLRTIHKIFQLRQCNDAFFRNRSRPCLQHQIKRCSAPCVGKISAADYAEDCRQATAMLSGHDAILMEQLATKMELASEQLQFEAAAVFRDRIALLQRIREKQYVSSDARDADIIAVAVASGMVCFSVVSIRHGRNLGAVFHIQPNNLDQTASQLLEAFLPQNYFGTVIPAELCLSEPIESRVSLQQVFSIENGRAVEIRQHCRAHRARWIESARIVTADHLLQYMSERSQSHHGFRALADALEMEEVAERIECFDISHTMGERTVGACVVFDRQGAIKSDYRRFNISGITPGDDYAAMEQVLTRRYSRVLKNEGKLPDLIIVDGGKGQLACAEKVMEELQILDSVVLMAVSKGALRKAGEEQFHISGSDRVIQPKGSSAESHLVQKIRDEAHRFAITAHRGRRAKARTISVLEQIDGVGDKRRRNILRYFGGIQEVRRASVEDIARVPGISVDLAKRIHNQFR